MIIMEKVRGLTRISFEGTDLQIFMDLSRDTLTRRLLKPLTEQMRTSNISYRWGFPACLFPMWFYGDSTSSNSWGIAIGFNKAMVFKVKEQLADPKGRFLFIKGKLFNMDCTFTSIYFPNGEQNKFLRKTLKKIWYSKKVNL